MLRAGGAANPRWPDAGACSPETFFGDAIDGDGIVRCDSHFRNVEAFLRVAGLRQGASKAKQDQRQMLAGDAAAQGDRIRRKQFALAQGCYQYGRGAFFAQSFC